MFVQICTPHLRKGSDAPGHCYYCSILMNILSLVQSRFCRASLKCAWQKLANAEKLVKMVHSFTHCKQQLAD